MSLKKKTMRGRNSNNLLRGGALKNTQTHTIDNTEWLKKKEKTTKMSAICSSEFPWKTLGCLWPPKPWGAGRGKRGSQKRAGSNLFSDCCPTTGTVSLACFLSKQEHIREKCGETPDWSLNAASHHQVFCFFGVSVLDRLKVGCEGDFSSRQWSQPMDHEHPGPWYPLE